MAYFQDATVDTLVAEGCWEISDTLEKIANSWAAAAPPDNRFLQLPFLRAVAAAPPRDIDLRYAVYSHAGRPVGVVLLQLATFHAASNIKTDESPRGIRQNVYAGIRGVVSRKAAFRTLTCGNFLLSGQHGFYFDPQIVAPAQRVALVEEALHLAQASFAQAGQKVNGHFVKDIEPALGAAARKYLCKREFHEVSFQPNMVLTLDAAWEKRDDYLAAMTSKYRVRARKATAAAAGVTRERWSIAQIDARRHELYALYEAVAAQADFSLVHLTADYLPALAHKLDEHFHLTAYTLDGVLIGFRTTIENYGRLEAHFLGYDPAYRRSHRLYQNMLYDLAEEGIRHNCGTVVYARTALEIKSTVGAAPEPLVSFLRHDKRWANCLLPRIFDYLAPKIEWTQRHPFKTK